MSKFDCRIYSIRLHAQRCRCRSGPESDALIASGHSGAPHIFRRQINGLSISLSAIATSHVGYTKLDSCEKRFAVNPFTPGASRTAGNVGRSARSRLKMDERMWRNMVPFFHSVVLSPFLPTLITTQANEKFHPSPSLARVNTTVPFLLSHTNNFIKYNRYFFAINAYMSTVATRNRPDVLH
jgi:hypothetical protein